MIKARDLWIKRNDSSGVGMKKLNDEADSNINVKYYPMLARPYDECEKYLTYPLYVQPKLDGLRCIIYLKEKSNIDSIECYSRNMKLYPDLKYITDILYPILDKYYNTETNKSLYLDGELYKHGKSLQDISGDGRSGKTKKNNDRNQYHIYDCFYPDKLDMPFKERTKIIDEIFNLVDNTVVGYTSNPLVDYTNTLVDYTSNTLVDKSANNLVSNLNVIFKVNTHEVNKFKKVNKLYTKYLEENYEGVMLRNGDSPYLADPVKTGAKLRSKELAKLKMTFTEEYECVSYTEGENGNSKGAVIWICKIDDSLGTVFKVTPKNITMEDRYKLYNKCVKNFKKYFEGRMLTVEHQGLSSTGVPLRAKALVFRDSNIV